MFFDRRDLQISIAGSLGALGLVLLLLRRWHPELPQEIGAVLFPLLGIATALAGRYGALWLADLQK